MVATNDNRFQKMQIVDETGNVVSSFSGGGGGGGTTNGANQLDVTESRTLNAATLNAAQVYTLNGQGTFAFQITGLAASGATVAFEQSNDWNGTTGTWQVVNEYNTGTGVGTTTRTTDGASAIGIEGTKAIRIRVSTVGTGTITIASNISVAERYTALRAPLPPGSNKIGGVTEADGDNAALGAKADAAATSDTGAFSLIAFLKRGLANWTTLLSRILADGVQNTYTIGAAGAQVGVPTAEYGSALLELTGTFSATVVLQASSDTTDGVNGTWTTMFGIIPEDNGGTSPTSALTTSTRRRLYRLPDGEWVRVNTTVYTSGSVVATLTRRKAPIGERAVYVGAIASGINVIGSTTMRGAGTNKSATIGTTASTPMAANSIRQGWKIKNDSTGDIWINFDTTATAVAGGGNIKVAAGGYLASEPGFVETGAMSVIGSAASLNITIREH